MVNLLSSVHIITECYDKAYIDKLAARGYPDFVLAKAEGFILESLDERRTRHMTREEFKRHTLKALVTVREACQSIILHDDFHSSELSYCARIILADYYIALSNHPHVSAKIKHKLITEALHLYSQIFPTSAYYEKAYTTYTRYNAKLGKPLKQLVAPARLFKNDRSQRRNRVRYEEIALGRLKQLLNKPADVSIYNVPALPVGFENIKSESAANIYKLTCYTINKILVNNTSEDVSQHTLLHARAIMLSLLRINDLDTRLRSKLIYKLAQLNTQLYVENCQNTKALKKASMYLDMYKNTYGYKLNKIKQEKVDEFSLKFKANLKSRKLRLRSKDTMLDIFESSVAIPAKFLGTVLDQVGMIVGTILNVVTILPVLLHRAQSNKYQKIYPLSDFMFSDLLRNTGKLAGYTVGAAIGLLAFPFVYVMEKAHDLATSSDNRHKAYDELMNSNCHEFIPSLQERRVLMADKIRKHECSILKYLKRKCARRETSSVEVMLKALEAQKSSQLPVTGTEQNSQVRASHVRPIALPARAERTYTMRDGFVIAKPPVKQPAVPVVSPARQAVIDAEARVNILKETILSRFASLRDEGRSVLVASDLAGGDGWNREMHAALHALTVAIKNEEEVKKTDELNASRHPARRFFFGDALPKLEVISPALSRMPLRTSATSSASRSSTSSNASSGISRDSTSNGSSGNASPLSAASANTSPIASYSKLPSPEAVKEYAAAALKLCEHQTAVLEAEHIQRVLALERADELLREYHYQEERRRVLEQALSAEPNPNLASGIQVGAK